VLCGLGYDCGLAKVADWFKRAAQSLFRSERLIAFLWREAKHTRHPGFRMSGNIARKLNVRVVRHIHSVRPPHHRSMLQVFGVSCFDKLVTERSAIGNHQPHGFSGADLDDARTKGHVVRPNAYRASGG
jgi:hypothetical protein